MKIQKNVLWLSLIVVIVVVAAYFFLRSPGGNANVIDNNSKDETQNVQVVKMHVEGSSYVLEPSSVKKGVPVRIEADISRLPGCSKAVVIPDFNVQKNLNANNNVIQFTPDKTGTFSIRCSMNMYRGKFSVID